MTLIAFHVDAESANIVTDSATYETTLRTLGHTSKLMLIPHLDGAVLSQGSSAFGQACKTAVLAASGDCPDFDTLATVSPDLCRDIWAELAAHYRRTGNPRPITRSLLILVGYSPAAERFVAYSFASDDDFTPTEVEGMFIHPSPLTVLPSAYELRSIRQGAHPEIVSQIEELPAPAPPRNPDEWANVAVIARRSRSYLDPDTGLKVFVGGSVFHTRLERGYAETGKVMEFDQDSEDFQAVIAGTLHPQSQLGPCGCGSGEQYLACCLLPHLDQPCLCGSGVSLRACCSVITAAPSAIDDRSTRTAATTASQAG